MPRTAFVAVGTYVPDRVVTNDDLAKVMETSDAWIQERTGIKERRWVPEGVETDNSELALQATNRALAKAGWQAKDIEAIVYCSMSPDHMLPADGCFLNRKLGLPGVPAIDIRNQCTGFLYGLAVADAWIRIGMYRRVLLVGSEIHSTGLDVSTRGRDTAVIFGDGAGAGSTPCCGARASRSSGRPRSSDSGCGCSSATAPARRSSRRPTSRGAACSPATSTRTAASPRTSTARPPARSITRG
jgi:3-oxoacyl-(acyl-carrier-protein) synthase III